jgi:hypothetical protein
MMAEVRMRKQVSRLRFAALAGGTLVAAALLLPFPVSAHHGWGGYLDAEYEITGIVVSPVSLAGPHASMTIRADGHVWSVVMAPPARAERAGLKEGMIPVGAKVTAHGHRHRDNNKFEIKTERLTWGDKVFNVYPDRT